MLSFTQIGAIFCLQNGFDQWTFFGTLIFLLFFGGTSYFHLKSKPLVDYVVLGPVTPLQILPTNEPDDLYTIQNNNLKFAAKLAFSISPTSSAQPRDPFFSKVEKKIRGTP